MAKKGLDIKTIQPVLRDVTKRNGWSLCVGAGTSVPATIVGLTFGANKNHIVRAALESMAYQSKDVLEAMKQDSQIEISSMKVDGGAAANNFLLQFQSDLLQMPVQRFKTNELTALGAAYLAGLSCGYWTQDELGVDLQKEFVPEKSKEEMDSLYSNWKKAVKTCQSYK